MFLNPIIHKYCYSQFRPRQIWVFGTIYVCFVALLSFINISIYNYGRAYRSPTSLYASLFAQFLVLELFFLCLVCPMNCCNVIYREVIDKSFDFFRMLPLSASKKLVGILVGCNLFSLCLSLVNLILCLAFGFAAKISWDLILQIFISLIVFSVLINLLGLLFSILSFKKDKTKNISSILVIAFFFMPIIQLIALDAKLEKITGFFYTLEIPILYLFSLYAFFFVLWAYLGILRRFTFEYEALFSRLGAYIFTLTSMFMLLGLFYHFFLKNYTLLPTIRRFWFLSMIPIFIVPLFSIQSFDKSLEITRGAGKLNNLSFRLMIHSNIFLGIVLFSIWIIFSIVTCRIVQTNVSYKIVQANMIDLKWLALMTFSFFLVVMALIEIYAVWKPKNEKIAYLLYFLVLLYIFLPAIFSIIFDKFDLIFLSPLGLFQIFEMKFQKLTVLFLPILLNLIYFSLLCLFIFKRYNDLIKIRKNLEKI